LRMPCTLIVISIALAMVENTEIDSNDRARAFTRRR
jgi:hypothetical protein